MGGVGVGEEGYFIVGLIFEGSGEILKVRIRAVDIVGHPGPGPGLEVIGAELHHRRAEEAGRGSGAAYPQRNPVAPAVAVGVAGYFHPDNFVDDAGAILEYRHSGRQALGVKADPVRNQFEVFIKTSDKFGKGGG